MKRLTKLLLALILLTASTAFAQEEADAMSKMNSGPKISKGIRVGWNMAMLTESGVKPDTAKSLNRFYVGFFTETKSSKLFSFGSGLEYLQNGTRYNDVSRVFHTLSVPIYAKLNVGPAYGMGGLGINMTLVENLVTEGEVTRVPKSIRSNWFDFPVYVGAGVKLGPIIAELRYHWGLLEVRNEMKHRYLQVGLGINF